MVFGRWVLPRIDLTRMALSDLLLDYFGKASDIMELYALFDEEIVRANLTVTLLILSIWSLSFLQFVPVLVHKHRYRRLQSCRLPCVSEKCIRHLPEIFDTCATFFLQDGPFLCLRIYVMVELDLFTYSLVFFVLKNIFTLMLLLYRFHILCCSRKRCCAKFSQEFNADEDNKSCEKHAPMTADLKNTTESNDTSAISDADLNKNLPDKCDSKHDSSGTYDPNFFIFQ